MEINAYPLLTLIPTLFDFLSSAKGDILKNADNQMVLVPFDPHCIFPPYNGNQWESKLSGYQHSS